MFSDTYLAGFFDGEGCVGVYKNGGKSQFLSVQISQNKNPHSAVLMGYIHDRFGGSLNEFASINGKRKYQWQIVGDKAVTFLTVLLPFLGMKREQAELAVAWQNTRPKVLRDHRGRISARSEATTAFDNKLSNVIKLLKEQSIDEVMANQADLVEIVHTLKQVCCVKGA